MSGRFQEPERLPGRPGAPLWRGGVRGIAAVTLAVLLVLGVMTVVAFVVAASY